MTVGNKLSKLRKENNYTQEQLAEILGVSRQAISKWESDITHPETDKLIRMRELFDCSLDYLLKEAIEADHKSQPDGITHFFRERPRERKSEKTVWGMPVWHIGRNARGFVAVGLNAYGVIASGLKWNAIDFASKTIAIRHTVTVCHMGGKHVEIAADTTKTKSSLRTLPLVPIFQEKLLALKERQQENRRLCGRSYCKDYLDYICVDEMGFRIKPAYLTMAFPQLLERNNMRVIRFHDLRHSCASLLLANGVPMKQIQEWLGHSDFSTTANIYAHLDYQSKLTSAEAIARGLGMNLENLTG